MTKFPTYSMAGIGIADAIAFVFVLSFVSNNARVDTGNDSIQEQSGSEPSSLLVQQQKMEESQRMEAKRMGEPENEASSTGECQFDDAAGSAGDVIAPYAGINYQMESLEKQSVTLHRGCSLKHTSPCSSRLISSIPMTLHYLATLLQWA